MSFTAHIKTPYLKHLKYSILFGEICSVAYNQPKQLHTLVLSVEYASSVWDPYKLVYINDIENIQRRAAHSVLNDYSRCNSVTSMLQLLQWPTLEKVKKQG